MVLRNVNTLKASAINSFLAKKNNNRDTPIEYKSKIVETETVHEKLQ